MYNPISPQQAVQLRRLIEEEAEDLIPYREEMVLAAQNCICLVPTDPDQGQSKGASRLGGLPDVPRGFTWPDGYSFVAQINLSEAAIYDHNGLLPRSGLLSFFLRHSSDNMGKVHYYDGELEGLHQERAPVELGNWRDDRIVYNGFQVEFQQTISLPGGSHPVLDWAPWQDPAEDEEDIVDLYHDFRQHVVCGAGRLLGYHDPLNDDVAEDACLWSLGFPHGKPPESSEVIDHIMETVSRYLNPEPRDSLLRAYRRIREDWFRYQQSREQVEIALKTCHDDWTALLLVWDCEGAGLYYGDYGVAQYLIRKENLARRQFEEVYVSIDSC